MKKPWELIAELESDNSKLFKEAVIAREAAAKNEEFFKGLLYTFDGFNTFGIKKVPVRTGTNGRGLSMDTFSGMVEMLQQRQLTGGDAQRMIETLMKSATNDQWNNWYRRILTRKLDAGFSESTVNKAVGSKSSYFIPVFSCALAKDGKDLFKDDILIAPERISGKRWIDFKFDGARILTFLYPDGTVEHKSRNGLIKENFPHIRQQFAGIKVKEPMVIDGEMMSKDFQALMKQFNRKSNVKTDDAIYYIFDILPLSEFIAGKSKKKQTQRFEQLDKFLDDNKSKLKSVDTVPRELIDMDTPSGKAKFNKFNRLALESKLEGVMIKDPDGYYETKRTWAWIKKKPKFTVSLPVVGFQLGKPDGQFHDCLGNLECAGIDDSFDPRFVEANVGGGFTPEERVHLWKYRHKLKGMIAEIETDGITTTDKGNSLRFPQFKNFRGKKPHEKI